MKQWKHLYHRSPGIIVQKRIRSKGEMIKNERSAKVLLLSAAVDSQEEKAVVVAGV